MALGFRRSDAAFVLAAVAALLLIAAVRPDADHATIIKRVTAIDRSGAPLQCAIYARARSGLELTGAARTWWAQAEGRYPRAHRPAMGAVIVMGGTRWGHVGVVSEILSERQILIDHANWLGDGEIITGALVEDVSDAGDWSAVRVWNAEAKTLGSRAYPVFGFVLARPA